MVAWVSLLSTGNRIIVNGACYTDAGNSPDSKRTFLGFAGAVWVIEELATGKRWTTNNLWHQGTIPEELGRADTHRFIKGE